MQAWVSPVWQGHGAPPQSLSSLSHVSVAGVPVRQGVTTVVVGNCGSSPWPLSAWDEALDLAYSVAGALPRPDWRSWGDYLDAIDAARPAVNVATLVGHGSVRREVLGQERRAPTAAELDRMRGVVGDAVAEGAVGLSTGLIYVPGIYAETDEIVALAQASAAAGGLYASHIRGEGRDLAAAQEGARVRAPPFLQHARHHGGARRLGEPGQFVERLLGIDTASQAGHQTDQRGAFGGMGRSTCGAGHDSHAF